MTNRKLLEAQQKIVVLDDDPQILQIFEKILFKSFTECDIKYYDYPTADFCKYVTNNQIDLFIMDIKLGKFQNGIQLSRDIIYKKRGTIFLFISGYPFNKLDFEDLDGRCVYDFMSKPIDGEYFNTVVSTLLNIASTYKIAFKNTRIIPRENDIDELRKTYLDQIMKDRLLINNIKETIYT